MRILQVVGAHYDSCFMDTMQSTILLSAVEQVVYPMEVYDMHKKSDWVDFCYICTYVNIYIMLNNSMSYGRVIHFYNMQSWSSG